MIKEQTVMLPKTLQWILLKSVHDSSPLERDALTRLVEKLFSSIGLSQIILEIMNACNICHHITSRGENLGPYPSSNPFKEEEVIWRRLENRLYSYAILPSFPRRTKRAREVVKSLLKEIIPQFIPLRLLTK